MSFEIGQRVKLTQQIDSMPVGSLGTVVKHYLGELVKFRPNENYVRFDNDFTDQPDESKVMTIIELGGNPEILRNHSLVYDDELEAAE